MAGGTKHVLLTGGTGFFGSAILRRLRAASSLAAQVTVLTRSSRTSSDGSVRFVQADLSDPVRLRAVADVIGGVDILVDVAALMPYAQRPRTSWASLVRVNLGGVANLLLHLLTPPGWVVYVSSTDVYGESRNTAITEQTPPAPQTEYAVTKLFAEYMYTRYCEDRGIPCTILRPCSIYGPADPSAKVVNTFTRKALAGQDVEIHGDGEDLRDFIFVEDAARMVLDVLERRILGTYNLVTGRSHRILDVVHTLEARLGRRLTVRYLPRRGRRRDWRFAPSSLIARGVPAPAVPLPDGLWQVIQAFQAGGVRHAAC